MYERIKRIKKGDDSLANSELAALSRVWLERKDKLLESGEFKQFLKKLQREWAIETGIIERLYSWDRGVTEILIEHGIDASLISHKGGVSRKKAEQINNIINDQLEIVEGLFAHVKGEQPLTEHFIRGLQSQFTEHQRTIEVETEAGNIIQVEILRGEYKKLPNNPRRPNGEEHEYCPPDFVNEEMEKLVAWNRLFDAQCPPEIVAAWLHHRFTQIHPFQDGNGRVARTLASLVFLKAGLFPLVIREADRRPYIKALEEADAGKLGPLVNLFVARQRHSILAAIGLEQQVQQQRFAEEVIRSAIEVLKDKSAAKKQNVEGAYGIAQEIQERVLARMGEIADVLNVQLRELTPAGHKAYHANSKAAENGSDQGHYFYSQIVQTAKQYDYYANLDTFRSWCRMAIVTEHVFEFVVSMHGLGHGRNGVLAVSAFTFQRVPTETQNSEFVNVRPSTSEIFQFNYAESKESIESRFEDWLEAAFAIALSEWKRLIES